MEKSQGFKPDPGNLAVRHYRGASGNVATVELNPPRNRKGEAGNPPPVSRRARALSQLYEPLCNSLSLPSVAATAA
jgi:hypothetical protein